MGIGPRMIRCERLDGNWDNSRMIQYRWDRREERKMRGVRLSWSLGDRRRRPRTEKSGMLLMYFNMNHYIWLCIYTTGESAPLLLLWSVIVRPFVLAAESLSLRVCVHTNEKQKLRVRNVRTRDNTTLLFSTNCHSHIDNQSKVNIGFWRICWFWVATSGVSRHKTCQREIEVPQN